MAGTTAELWHRTDALGFLRAWTTGEVSQGPHAEHTGNRLVEVVGPGQLIFDWLPGPQLANLSGGVHGGYLALICDEVAGISASARGERFVPMLTLDLDVTFLKPTVIGAHHRVDGQVLHFGGTRIISEARILRPDGTLAVTARGSFVPNRSFAPGS